MKVLSPFCGSLLTPPCWAKRSPNSHYDWPQLVLFLKHSCILLTLLLRPKWCYLILSTTYDRMILTKTYSMAPVHSLVDDLRIKNRCHQKESDALRPQYLIHHQSENSHALNSHKGPLQICWLLSLEWVSYFEHVLQCLLKNMFF